MLCSTIIGRESDKSKSSHLGPFPTTIIKCMLMGYLRPDAELFTQFCL